MPTTRAATRAGSSSANNSPAASQTKTGGAGTKRKAEGTPTKAKRGKKSPKKEQKTLDQTMDIDKLANEDKPKREGPDPRDTVVDSDEEDAKAEEKAKQAEKEEKKAAEHEKKQTNGEASGENKSAADKKSNGDEASNNDAKDSKPETEKPSADEEEAMIKASEDVEKNSDVAGKADEPAKADDTIAKPALNCNTEQANAAIEKSLEQAEPEKAVEQDSNRAKAEPSNILEKGIIYFFTRGRVGLDDPSSVDEIQRTYIILRPMPSGAKLADSAPIGDAGKNRIIALPKKVFPASRRDTFLCFVEAADASFDAIREQHLKQSDYATKTMGSRHTPSAKPIAEGIYALTSTGRESHLSYILTVPEELGDVQREMGLTSRGAFITSVKNPETPTPQGNAPQQTADYPEGILKDFRGLRWGRLEPAHLDFVNTQFLLIGEGEQDKLEKAVQADKGDGQQQGKEEPLEAMEHLSKEDHDRIKGLNGDDSDAIFKDMGLNKEEYSKIQTKWE